MPFSTFLSPPLLIIHHHTGSFFYQQTIPFTFTGPSPAAVKFTAYP